MERTCSRCGHGFNGVEGQHQNLCKCCRKPRRRKPPYVLGGVLTFREKQVCELNSQAMANKEIAWELHLTEGTVKEYLNRIFKKMGCRNRTELAMKTVANRVLSPAPALLP